MGSSSQGIFIPTHVMTRAGSGAGVRRLGHYNFPGSTWIQDCEKGENEGTRCAHALMYGSAETLELHVFWFLVTFLKDLFFKYKIIVPQY